MSLLNNIKRMEFIDFLVKRKATGNLEVFAKKNRLSKRGLTDVLQQMKKIGFPIKYSRSIGSYYYEEDGEMVKCLFIRDIEKLQRDEMKKVIFGDADNLCFSKKKVFEVCIE